MTDAPCRRPGEKMTPLQPAPPAVSGETRPTLVQLVRAAWANPAHREIAAAAFDLLIEWAPNLAGRSRVPGMDTELRLAVRAARGLAADQAAGREYLYRWQLFLAAMINYLESRSTARGYSIWPAPHLLGM